MSPKANESDPWKFNAETLKKLRGECNAKAALQAKARLECLGEANPEKFVLTVDDELTMLKHFIMQLNFQFAKFTSKNVPIQVYEIAVTYFKRFYLKHSLMDFNGMDIAILSIFLALKTFGKPLPVEEFLNILDTEDRNYWFDYLPKSDSFLVHELDYDLEVESIFSMVDSHINGILWNFQQSIQEAKLCQIRLFSTGHTITRSLYDTDACFLLTSLEFTMAALLCLEKIFPALPVKRYFNNIIFCENPQLRSEWEKAEAFVKYVAEYRFLTLLNRVPRLECALKRCINPIYNIRSKEYADKTRENLVSMDEISD